jgi:hypothetical protein
MKGEYQVVIHPLGSSLCLVFDERGISEESGRRLLEELYMSMVVFGNVGVEIDCPAQVARMKKQVKE